MSEPSPVQWRDDGVLQSAQYGDVYFSSDDGLAESQAVYLQGCGLPQAWSGRAHFTVGELGFGTGLNIAALLTLWRDHRPPGGRLTIFSVERHLMDARDAERALDRWPQIAPAAQALLAAWPSGEPGFHRLDLPGFEATLDLAVMDASQALEEWDGRADAWLLDGFSPAVNPAMWTPTLMQAVADRSAPGARAATFTVAGAVRRALSDAGFAVERRPGFGRKRQRLEAILPGAAPVDARPGNVAVIGAGIAGAAMARALDAIGASTTVFDAAGRGAGASGNPAALVTPALDAGEGPRARFFAQAHRRAAALLAQVDGAVIAHGVVQLEADERDAGRFEKIAAGSLYGGLCRLDPTAASARLGEVVGGGLDMTQALVAAPGVVLAAWAPRVFAATVAKLERQADGWRLIGADGADLGAFAAVVLASGADMQRLWPQAPLQSVRGQASWVEGAKLGAAAAFGGYAVPTGEGLLFGATHDRDIEDETTIASDHARNLALLAKGLPQLARAIADLPMQGRARRRAATPDRMPIAGAAPGADGLYVLGGLGSRGFCTAPLLAEHVAALIAGVASPLPGPLSALISPDRAALWRRKPSEPS